MRAWLGTAVFLLLAPGVMGGLVPWLISGWDGSPRGLDALDVVGGVLVAAGALVVLACFARFAREGRGTPAGQAVAFRSVALLGWLVVFEVAVVSFTRVYEEPTLREQFGADYDAYAAAVPGWWPRLRPWQG